ncbi:uncharacterized protein LOC120713568 [Panicum virgatum]|uniref:uncharacterized protein LOC120713568 n=1 Tax=Panicum virgatum TaxID=38727 RepID=UPI0019D5F790|nr:uncharacterized protein LOC120713568 [Panicum virgatum]
MPSTSKFNDQDNTSLPEGKTAQPTLQDLTPEHKRKYDQVMEELAAQVIQQFTYINRIEPFMPLVKIKSAGEFFWGQEQQKAFDNSKQYLSSPPVLVPPRSDQPFTVYLSADAVSVGSVLIQEFQGKERIVFYLSRRLLDAETRYNKMERLCLCLYFTCTKLWHYLLNAETHVVCKADVIKHMLAAPILKGRLGKWMYALSEFDVRFQPAKAVKGQALADLITERVVSSTSFVGVRPWVLFFDGSTCDPACGVGLYIVSSRGVTFQFAFRLASKLTNNQTEYEAVHKGLELLLDAGAEVVEIFGDSKVVIRQLTEDYDCVSDNLYPYFIKCHDLMVKFRQVMLTWIPREQNGDANRLAQVASGYIPQTDDVSVDILQQSAVD